MYLKCFLTTKKIILSFKRRKIKPESACVPAGKQLLWVRRSLVDLAVMHIYIFLEFHLNVWRLMFRCRVSTCFYSTGSVLGTARVWRNSRPGRDRADCQPVTWLWGPRAQAAECEVLMDRYVGAFTGPLSGRCNRFWQLVCSHFTWLEPTPEPQHHPGPLLRCCLINHSYEFSRTGPDTAFTD